MQKNNLFIEIGEFISNCDRQKDGYRISHLGNHGVLFNSFFKGLILGSMYCLKTYIKHFIKKKRYCFSYRAERIIHYMNESAIEFKNPITRSYIGWFAFIFVFFLDIDNAYFQWFHRFLESYYKEFRRGTNE